MAASNCIRCANKTFELKEARNVGNSDFKWQFLQCAKCGGVVGVLDHTAIGELLLRMAKALGLKL